jgi:hypothetical protein
MIKILISIITIIVIFYISNYLLKKKEYFENYQSSNDYGIFNSDKASDNSRIIWMYWETLPGKKKPGYIDLCIESVKFNCGKCFEVIVLDNHKIMKCRYFSYKMHMPFF